MWRLKYPPYTQYGIRSYGNKPFHSAGKVRAIPDAISGMLPMTDLKVRRLNSEGEEVVSAAEFFPDASPAKALLETCIFITARACLYMPLR